MSEKTSNTNDSFLTYYLPCIFLLLAALVLALTYLFAPNQFKILPVLGIIIFSLYRWYVSRWIPKIFDPKAAFKNAQQEYRLNESRRSAQGLVVLDTGPGILEKVFYWFTSKILSIVVLFFVWIPMELFIQLKFILKARTAWKEGHFLSTRRGQWPGRESRHQDK